MIRLSGPHPPHTIADSKVRSIRGSGTALISSTSYRAITYHPLLLYLNGFKFVCLASW